MRSAIMSASALAVAAQASSLASVCTTAHVKASLPGNGTIQGLIFYPDTVTASPIYNETIAAGTFFPAAVIDFCNVTFAYGHNGTTDQVLQNYWMPSPSKFKNRWLTTGGEALDINGGTSSTGSLPGGVMYGAATGLTDGGFGGFTVAYDAVNLLANGTLNYEPLFMFGYKAIRELTEIGKDFTSNFYSANGSRVYSYYQACSEGGREGMSQVQRYKDAFDGAIIGAPAMRYAQQQAQHLYSNVVEKTLDYFPPPCELDKIINATIAFCDPLDGKTDSVISRSDLCKLHFNLNSTIGLPYSCAASTSTSLGLDFGARKMKRQEGGASSTPAQNGTVSAKGVAVAQAIIDGLHNSKGQFAYLSYQIGADFEDAATQYNTTTDTWVLDIAGAGGEWVARWLELVEADNIDSLDDVTYDTMVQWMILGQQRYADTLQTNNPDLTPYHSGGGKVLTFHGEQDPSVPTGSSVHFYDSVRRTMYPHMSYNSSVAAMDSWYRLFLIPGAAHCATNPLQPGPFPQTNFQVMIDWVENGVLPETLNATYLSGTNEGDNAQICGWPLRPFWTNNGTTFTCQYDQASINTWKYNFDAYKLPLY